MYTMAIILVFVLQQPKATDQSDLAVLRRRFRTINNLLKCLYVGVHK